MKKAEILKQLRIDKLGNDTIFIQNKFFNFSFTLANSVCREDLKGQYRYFGGLQCDYEQGSEDYNRLEGWLCVLAESVLNLGKSNSNEPSR